MAEHRGLQLVEARVAAAVARDAVLAVPAVLVQPADAGCDLVGRRRDGTAVAERAEVLGGIEGEGCGVGERADPACVGHATEGLRAVLEYLSADCVGGLDDRADVGGATVEMRHDHDADVIGDPRSDVAVDRSCASPRRRRRR